MNRTDPPDLAALLAESPPLEERAEGLLTLLAAAHADPLALAERLDHDAVAWDDLRHWLAAWPAPPDSPQAMRAWLRETEQLGFALRTLEQLERGEAADLRATSSRLRQDVERRDDHALYAGMSDLDVPPWSWLRRGELSQLLGQRDEELVELALRGQLAPEDAEALADAARTTALGDVYRARVEALTRTLYVTTWTPAWSLDVARDERELEQAATLLEVHLPHAGGVLQVSQHADGAWWSPATGDAELVSYASETHRWADELLGELTTRFEVHTPSPAEDAWHGVASLMKVARGEGGGRGLEVAQAVADALNEGAMSDAIAKAHEAFELGEDLADEDERLVSHAFVARMHLTDATATLARAEHDVATVQETVIRSDARHRAHRSAGFLVPDHVYEDHVGSLPVDASAWWGHRAHVEGLVPEGAIESLLADLAGAAEEAPSNVTDLATFRQKRDAARLRQAEQVTRMAAASARPREGSAGVCAWFQSGAPSAGHVPVVLYDEENDRGVLAELVIRVADTVRDAEAWERAPMLRSIARETLRHAHRAAAALAHGGVAPAFGMHRFELRVDGDHGRLAVDGNSLGLSAALAFLSVWSGRGIDRGIAPIATIAWGLAPVGAEAAKARALPPGVRALVATDSALEDDDAVRAAKLEDAARRAGLALSDVTFASRSRRDLERELQALVEAVENDELGRVPNAGWLDVADRIRALTDALAAMGVDVARARAFGALAYTHGGAFDDAIDLLRGVDRDACDDLATRTLCDVVALGALIDKGAQDAPDGTALRGRLEADVAELRESRQGALLGRALGTLGRVELHSRRPDSALPLLHEAIEAHREREPHEVPRSRMYYAMALRMSGEPEEALDELRLAQRELETLTRPYSGEYEASCRRFIEYELARTLVALERYEEALEPATRAIEDCGPAAWPALGLYRTRAWALRMLGEAQAAEDDVAAARGARSRLPSDVQLADRILEEAEGLPVDDGEIY